MFSSLMMNTWIAATIVALIAGAIGFFAVLRGQSFAAHAIPNGAFAGASVNGAAPTAGSAPNMTAGALFGGKNLSGDYNTQPGTGVGVFNRDTYNVIPASFLSGSATSKQQALTSILGGGIGGNNGKAVIRSFGFGTLSYIGNSTFFLDGGFQH